MLKANSTAKAGWILPNVEYTKPKILGVIKAPYAATEATKPVIKEESNGLPNTCGIIRNVAPVAKPQHTKVNTDIARMGSCAYLRQLQLVLLLHIDREGLQR